MFCHLSIQYEVVITFSPLYLLFYRYLTLKILTNKHRSENLECDGPRAKTDSSSYTFRVPAPTCTIFFKSLFSLFSYIQISFVESFNIKIFLVLYITGLCRKEDSEWMISFDKQLHNFFFNDQHGIFFISLLSVCLHKPIHCIHVFNIFII